MWKTVLFLGFFLLSEVTTYLHSGHLTTIFGVWRPTRGRFPHCRRWGPSPSLRPLLRPAPISTKSQSNGCVSKSYGHDKTVCVCNATYCDETPEQDPKVPVDGTFYWYTSSKDGQRLNFSKKQFGQCPYSLIPPLTLNVDNSVQYQKILGFGGAFTDSAGINIKKLSEPVQEKLLCTYFCAKGSRYSLGRLPIGSTDFSMRPYTYDDHDNDLTLTNFSLASEDYNYKIPYIQKAQKLNPELLMVSAAWSAPPWMKTNHKVNGYGLLKKKYYQLYADYILKFLEEYYKNDIDVWAVSTGNEPSTAIIPLEWLSNVAWTAGTVSKWVGNNLGPTLAASSRNNTKILLLDDHRIFLPWFVQDVLANQRANHYASGIAVHFYADILDWPNVLTQTHDLFPDKFILMTEASLGNGPFIENVDMGSWDRGEIYMSSILDYLNNWSVGWMDWNLALDETGGPNWMNNNNDSPIIVNATADEFYKQPMFYALKHLSRFVERGSTRISITDNWLVKSAAFVTPSNEIVVVLFNGWDIPRTVVVNDLKKGKLCVEVPAHSMHTIIYRN